MSNLEFLHECGYNTPIASTKLSDKNKITRIIMIHCVILTSSAEIVQFREGLHQVKGLKAIMESHIDLLMTFYCLVEIKMTAGKTPSHS